MADIAPDVQAQLRAMTPAEWDSFTAQVRPPDCREDFRQHAAQFVSDPDVLDALSNTVDLAQFVDGTGAIDPERVAGHLTALFGTAPPPPAGPPPPPPRFGNTDRRGAAGTAEAVKRFGTPKHAADQLPPPGQRQPGAGGRAEIAKRFGGTNKP